MEKKDEVVENYVEFSKDYYVLELETKTLSHIVSIDNLDNNETMFFDVIQSNKGKSVFMRFPKSIFLGMYKILE